MNTKRAGLFALFCACLLLLAALPRASAQSVTEGALEFSLLYGGKSYEVVSCDKTASGELVIPDTVNGLPVTQIGTSAFYGCEELTAVTIPNTVTQIYPNAFRDCVKLQSIVLPDSVIIINQGAFSGCAALAQVTIGRGLSYIEQSAFSNCTALTSIALPDSVVFLGYNAFEGCTGLTGITLSNNVTMNDPCFSGCDKLTYNIHDSGKYLGSATNPYLVLCDTVTDDITQLQIHPDTRIIYPQALAGCAQLTEITIPENVKTIGALAFSGCEKLEKITVGKGVSAIASNFTYGCDSLVGIWVSESNPKYCNDAHGVLFSRDMTIVLQAPQTLSGIYFIPESVTTVDTSAFYECDSLTNVLVGKDVTEIGNFAFGGCDNLVTILVSEDNANYKNDSSGVLFNKRNNMLLQAPGAISGDYAIPAGVKTVYPSAFAGCTQLQSVTLPDSVQFVSDSAFKDCTGLTRIVIPAGVLHIAQDTFAGCTGLTEIVIPDSVGSILWDAFAGCANLKTVCYTGAQKAWDKIDIKDGNDAIKNAELIVNYKAAAPTQPTTAPTTASTTAPTTASTTAPTTVPTTTPATDPTAQPTQAPTVPSAAPVDQENNSDNGWLFGGIALVFLAAGGIVTFVIYKKKKA